MLLRVCDMCGKRHLEYFKYTNAVRRSDVRIGNPYDTDYGAIDIDSLTIEKNGRAQFSGEICEDCAGSVEEVIHMLIKSRRAIKTRPSL